MAGSQLPEGETVKDSEQVGLPHGAQRAVALEHRVRGQRLRGPVVSNDW